MRFMVFLNSWNWRIRKKKYEESADCIVRFRMSKISIDYWCFFSVWVEWCFSNFDRFYLLIESLSELITLTGLTSLDNRSIISKSF